MRSQGDDGLGTEPNAFEAFDESIGIGQVRDPYPVFHEMMTESPVSIGRCVRLDPDAEDEHVSGLGFRSPRHLPVLFDG